MFKKETDIVGKKVSLKIIHKSKVLMYDLGYYGMRTFTAHNDDPYKYFNMYLDYKGDVLKDEVFFIMEEALTALNEVWVRESVDVILRGLSSNLMNLFDIDDVYLWVCTYSGLNVPSVFTAGYNEDITINKLGTREQTYIREDYRRLLGLALIMRVMTPIWSEYIGRYDKVLGTMFKEEYAFSLIQDSKLLHTDTYKKLYNYLKKIVEKNIQEKNNIGKLLLGISSEDLPEWTVGVTIVRRLAIADFEQSTNSTNLITNIFGFASSKMKGTISIEKTLHNKVPTEGRGNENDKTSSLENYKIVSEIPPGTIEELDFSVSNYPSLFDVLTPGIKNSLKKDCFKSRKALLANPILVPQLTLLKWTLAKVINPKGLVYLSKNRLVDLLCIAHAVLWHKKHKYLALLVTSVALDPEEIIITTTSGRSKINKEKLKTTLDELFPYMDVKRSYNGNETHSNAVINTINLLDEEITKKIWTFTCGKAYINSTFNDDSVSPPIPYDLRLLLADLCIDVAQNY